MNKRSYTYLLWLLRLTSALPFSIFYSSLELYLHKMSYNHATALVGNVLSLSFAIALIGGYIGDKLLSHKNLFLVSVVFQSIGCFLFSTSDPYYIRVFGCLFLLGSIGSTVSINMLLTKVFSSRDTQREKSFFLFYFFLNLGYLTGYLLAGYLANGNEYSLIQYATLASSLVSIILLMISSKYSHLQISLQKIGFTKTIITYLIAFFLLDTLLSHPILTNILLICFWILFSITMYIRLTRMKNQNNDYLRVFYVLLISATCFWSIYFLSPMALTIFAIQYVNLHIGSYVIAPQWLQIINTFVVIIGSVWFGNKISKNNYHFLLSLFAKGMLFLGLGFLILIIGLTQIKLKLNISWLIASYVSQSLGELCIGPIGYALIGNLIIIRSQSIMMGLWTTLLGVSSAIASFLSAMVIPNNDIVKIKSNHALAGYMHLFIEVCFFAFLISIILLFLAKDKRRGTL